MSYLDKIAARSRAEEIALNVGGTTAGLVGAESIINGIKDVGFKMKVSGIVKYAKQKHPELSRVSDSKLKAWANAIYTLTPRMSDSKELMADAIYQIYQYGGNIDLATAKIISEINKNSKRDKTLDYVNVAHNLTK